jgi:hypothetical protein
MLRLRMLRHVAPDARSACVSWAAGDQRLPPPSFRQPQCVPEPVGFSKRDCHSAPAEGTPDLEQSEQALAPTPSRRGGTLVTPHGAP